VSAGTIKKAQQVGWSAAAKQQQQQQQQQGQTGAMWVVLGALLSAACQQEQ
jgi:hypothetical protein